MKRFGEVVAMCLIGSLTAVVMAGAAWCIWMIAGMMW